MRSVFSQALQERVAIGCVIVNKHKALLTGNRIDRDALVDRYFFHEADHLRAGVCRIFDVGINLIEDENCGVSGNDQRRGIAI